jgi:membrane protein DedA with SNARE-associated domain
MLDAVVELAHQAVSSPQIYLALFVLAAIDGFFPAVPSESLVITAGVFATAGEPKLLLVIAVSALGAFVGDHTSYLIGRSAGARLLRRIRPGTRRRAALDRAGRALAERGGLLLVVARYIPGGRTAVTVTAGTLGYPLRWFLLFDAIAALSWSTYSALVGYLGGMAFEQDPVKGVLVSLGFAVTITVTVEVTRHLRRQSRIRSQERADGSAGNARLSADHIAAHGRDGSQS